MQCKRLKITGVVQNVGYRAWAKRLSRELSVQGYVKNMEDGSVEMVVCAEENIITVMINAAKKGPPTSVVKDVEVSDCDHKPDSKEFKIWI
jgi:acylphosphatase